MRYGDQEDDQPYRPWRPWPRRRPRIKSGIIVWRMLMDGVIGGGQNTISASLKFVDKAGASASPASPPSWTTGTSGIVSAAVAADGMSAVFTRVGPGSTTVDVIAEGDPTAGVDTVHLTGNLTVLPNEIASGEIDFGPAS